MAIKKQQVFVRAINKEGKWDSIDVLDLDDESFKAFVIDRMVNSGLLMTVNPEMVDGEPIQFKEKK